MISGHLLVVVLVGCASSLSVSDDDSEACDSEEWQYHNGNCYWSSVYQTTVSQHTNNWFGAERECRRHEADLVSIHDNGENHIAYKLTRCAPTWTGLTLVDHRQSANHNGYEWIDNSDRNYINWYPGNPNSNNYKGCTYLYGVDDSNAGKWVYGDCKTSRHYYVCKKQAIGNLLFGKRWEAYRLNNTQLVRGPCEPNWYVRGEKCYHVNKTKVDFFAGLLQCQSMGGHLATIHSSKEDADLIRVFNECDTPWIGLENIDPNNVGSNSGWRWNDNTIVDYSNWVGGKATNDHTRQCGRLERGAKWGNANCWNLHPFVCEKPKPNN